MERITLAELDIDIDAIVTKQAEYLSQISELKAAQSELKSALDDTTEATDEQAKSYVENDAALKKLNQEYNRNKAFLAEVETGVNGLTDAMNKENKSIEDARKNNSELTKIRNKVNTTTVEGRKAIEEINKKIDENNKFVKENVSQLEQQKINIGNYGSALDAISPGLGSFITGLQSSAQGMMATTRATNFLKVALLALPILAIVAAVSTLIKAWAGTQKGMDAINRLIAPLKGGFDSLIGVLQDISTNIFDTLGDRWTVVSGKIMQGLTLIQIGWAKVSGNTEKATLLLAEYDARAAEIAESQERINQKNQELSDILAGAVDRMKEGAETQKEIERLTIAIERAQIAATVPLEKARLAYMELLGASQDISKSDEERLQALADAEKQLQFIIKTEQDINNLKQKRLELSQTLNDTDRAGELELQQLIADGIAIQSENQKKLNTITKQREALSKKAATEAIKDVEQKAKAEIQAIKDVDAERRTVEEERKLRELIEFEEKLSNLRANSNSRLLIEQARLDREKQLEIQKAQETIENKELLTRKLELIDQKYADYQVQLEREVTTQKFMVISSLLGAVGGLLNRQSGIGKSLAIAQTLIDTYLGAQRAFSQTFGGIVIKSAAAAAAVAQGLGRVAAIRSVNVPKFKDGTTRVMGAGTETSDSILSLLSKNERVLSASDNRAIGFDMSNRDLVQAARMYKYNLSMNDRGIINAINETNTTLKTKPTLHITKEGLIATVSNGQSQHKYITNNFLS
jgi:hypothetical protein